MAVVKGLLMEVNGEKGVLMTADGQFVHVKLPSTTIALGEEITAQLWSPINWFKYSFIAAAVLLMFLLPGYNHLFTKQAVAYVALDINPSIELAVDKNTTIIKARGLNENGVKILREAQVTGQNLYQGLPQIVEQAIKDGYIVKEQQNVVLSTITMVDKQKTTPLDQQKITAAINQPIQQVEHLTTDVVMEQSDLAKRSEAQKMGLSTGKYILYQAAQQQGHKVTITEAKTQNVQQLISKSLPPGQAKKLEASKGGVQKLNKQMPPGQAKKIETIQTKKQPQQEKNSQDKNKDKKDNNKNKDKKDKSKKDNNKNKNKNKNKNDNNKK